MKLFAPVNKSTLSLKVVPLQNFPNSRFLFNASRGYLPHTEIFWCLPRKPHVAARMVAQIKPRSPRYDMEKPIIKNQTQQSSSLSAVAVPAVLFPYSGFDHMNLEEIISVLKRLTNCYFLRFFFPSLSSLVSWKEFTLAQSRVLLERIISLLPGVAFALVSDLLTRLHELRYHWKVDGKFEKCIIQEVVRSSERNMTEESLIKHAVNVIYCLGSLSHGQNLFMKEKNLRGWLWKILPSMCLLLSSKEINSFIHG
jgi:hypothetical protein